MENKDFILASGSKQRIELLTQIELRPKAIQPANIDEAELKNEDALPYIKRIARNKALEVAKRFPNENILSADTIGVVGQSIIHKSKTKEEQTILMNKLSGKTHRVITSVCFINKNGKISQKTVTSKITMKHLTIKEIEDYVASDEWIGVCGYKIEGKLSGFVKQINGSFSSIIGLPLYETKNILNSAGIFEYK